MLFGKVDSFKQADEEAHTRMKDLVEADGYEIDERDEIEFSE